VRARRRRRAAGRIASDQAVRRRHGLVTGRSPLPLSAP
jgi:hypothetical protein